ncbi:MAG TPA: hypothetical protein VFC31_14180 [Candidatus Limnocylindria bacterium]|nr:hypothetical protein [Candidatus Limnocylindria bacterium]
MTRRRRLAALVLLGGGAALLGWLGPSIPAGLFAGPAACGPGPSAVQFCPSLPAFQPSDSGPMRVVDQVRPCEDAATFRPSFCIALPATSVHADRATLVSRRQDACAQLSPREAPEFCFVIPSNITADATLEREAALVLLRQRLGSDFRRVSGGELELWAESGVSGADAERIDGILRDDAIAVRAYFARRFREAPAVFLFASQQSFGMALERQFGYAAGTAAQLSSQYGGILVNGIDAIAINGQNVLGGPRPTIFRHELSHVLTHQLAGVGLPMWFDEGLATLVAEPDASAFDLDRATAFSILGDDALRSIAFDEDRSWSDRNAALDGNAYGVAAEAVRLIVDRLDRAGITTMLETVGRGALLASAYVAATGEPLAQFVESVPGRVLAGCRRGISLSATRPDGLVAWRIYGFGPRQSVAITVDGPGHYAFSVATDRYGVYTGTLGGPMPSGTYILKATTGIATAVRISVPLGTPSAAPRRACGD